MSVIVQPSVIVACYLIGCFTAGYYLVRFRTGQDLRGIGSGSTGARNVSRIVGKPGFVITLLADAAKGAIAVLLALQFDLESWAVGLAIVAVVTGHIWPVQLGFHGGKGLATVLGVGLMLDLLLSTVAFGVALLVFGLTRRFTPAGLLSVAASPVIALALGHDGAIVIGLALAVTLILFVHRSNIAKLPEQEEPFINNKFR